MAAHAAAPHTTITQIIPCCPRRLISRRHHVANISSTVRPRASSSSSSSSSPASTSSSEFKHFEDVILSSSRTTEMAHALWSAVLRPGDTAIDATMGNGWDTMILANLVLGDPGDDDGDGDGDVAARSCGGRGRVVAFDIQQGALDSTRAKVERELTPQQAARVHLVLDSHDNMRQHVNCAADPVDPEDPEDDGGSDSDLYSAEANDSVGVVCFNLGYLPGQGSDKAVVTRKESTVAAVEVATAVLRPGGVVTVVGYTGHEGGWEEVEAVMEFVSRLDPRKFTATNHSIVNRDNCPQLIAVHRKEGGGGGGGGGALTTSAR